jgi:hypothetical protein
MQRSRLVGVERLIAAWNERQVRRMPLLFAPTIAAALAARHHFLWVYCPACRTTVGHRPRALDRHRDAAITSLIPSLSCRSCRPNAPFADLSKTSMCVEVACTRTQPLLVPKHSSISECKVD